MPIGRGKVKEKETGEMREDQCIGTRGLGTMVAVGDVDAAADTYASCCLQVIADCKRHVRRASRQQANRQMAAIWGL